MATTKYKKEYDDQAHRLALLGLIGKELAAFFEVSESTLKLWMGKNKSFDDAVRSGKMVADSNVALSLYKRANGYDIEESKDEYEDKKIVRQTKTIKHYPADVGAAFGWLRNRRPKWWSDQREDVKKDDRPILEGGKKLPQK